VELVQPLWSCVNKISPLVLASLLFASCAHQRTNTPSSEYEATIRAWQTHRDAGLRSPDGWLTLVGLFWLKSGENSIGSGPSNDFGLPPGAPSQLGSLRLTGGKVTFTNLADASIRVGDKPVTQPVVLSDDDDNPDVVHSGSISFYVIKRGKRLGIRAKDSSNPALKNFTGMQYFPVNPELHFADAKLIPDKRQIPILNIVGQTDLEESPGYVSFNYRGEEYRLRPIYEGQTLFFLFKDPTNKSTTYQAGRMLNTPLPKDGKVDLDFNRSYNPPCTFTPYATCPLPPKENTLSFPVEAGEKRYGHGR
jgi:uncharacterized protein